MTSTLVPAPSGAQALSDGDRLGRLRRMKALAIVLLLLAAAVFLWTLRLQSAGADAAWIGYLQAAAEAAMVGGLADWFAVTALFRRPLGLPIPHTALIPTRKDHLGRGLAEFVSANFLGDDVVRVKLARTAAARRAGDWLAVPEHARRVSDEAAALARGTLSVLGDEHVHETLAESLLPRLADIEVSPVLGRVLRRILDERGHVEVVTLLAGQAVVWVERNRERILDLIARQAPAWSPRFLDDAVGSRVHAELLRLLVAIRDDPDHAVRRSADRLLDGLADDLREDPALRARVQAAWVGWVTGSGGREALERVWTPLRHGLDQMVAEEDGPLRRRVTAGVAELGRRLATDPALQARVDGWVADAAVHVVSTYREEIVATISETVDRWDGQDTARRIELYAGRDLQFIRINGSVVGALAGLALHTVVVLLG